MNYSLRRRLPALFTLGLVLLLAGVSLWLLKVAQRGDSKAPAMGQRTEPDYVIEGFRYVKVARDGSAEYVIEGDRLVHDPVTDDSVITRARLNSYKRGRAPMTLSSDSARINGDHSEFRLIDNVRLDRPKARGSEALTVESDYMVVLPDKDIVKTDRAVRARLGNSTLQGVGMEADDRKRQLTLQSRVNATYRNHPEAGETR